jgi:hypothetical protein
MERDTLADISAVAAVVIGFFTLVALMWFF